MTIDEAIERLVKCKQESPLGGETRLYLGEPGRDYQPVVRLLVEEDHEGVRGVVTIH
jgi:hypothetical protein